MQIKTSFEELCKITNDVLLENEDEEIKFTLMPLTNGVIVDFHKLPLGIINYSGEVYFRLLHFEDEILHITFKFKNFFLEMLKKALIRAVIGIAKKQMIKNGVDIAKYIHYHDSEIQLEINRIMKESGSPLVLVGMESHSGIFSLNLQYLGLSKKTQKLLTN